ncbi:MAG TPA: hypothetical protein VFA09_16175 [Ktedonobacteraceae bacterium]|nr:hypothetical protein [Ktedonobacteraceae bacterium]
MPGRLSRPLIRCQFTLPVPTSHTSICDDPASSEADTVKRPAHEQVVHRQAIPKLTGEQSA